MYARAPLTFNEQNIAVIRKIFSSGPRALSLELPTSTSAAPRSEWERSRAGRRAAVLVPLCNHDGIASLLFTVRSSKVSTHKGQVSFPGGHLEAGEDAIEAALRETREEIGDSLGGVEVLGTCQALPAVTGTPVTPVLGFIRQDVGPLLHGLVLSPDEVESVFTLSVSELLDPSFRTMDDLGLRGKVPAFTAGPHRVWGLTAAITDGVLRNGIVPLLQRQACSQSPQEENRSSADRPAAGRDSVAPGSDDGPRRSSL